MDVRRPDLLETRTTGEVLHSIASGAWRDAVARIRELPADSQEQKAAKTALPFCTFAGVFSYRSNSALVQHSGQVGIDLDGLGEVGAVAVLQAAVADAFCLAAYRSTRGEGVRLLFKIPPCSAEHHAAVFERVALHVRQTYGHDADHSGKDVSRASFVSFDNGLWFNAAAGVLPLVLPGETQRVLSGSRCVSSSLYAGRLAEIWPGWYGRLSANTATRENGTAKTHDSLLELGKSLALHAEKIKKPLTRQLIESAFEAWLGEHARRGVQLRCAADDYRRELLASARGAERKPWFKPAAEKWLRWTQHAEFPRDGLPHERILFAIRCHCAESASPDFFIGVRDAGLVAGVSYITAWRMLCKLCEDGKLEKNGERRQLRDAQTYRLKTITRQFGPEEPSSQKRPAENVESRSRRKTRP
jgi:hypothetical protein